MINKYVIGLITASLLMGGCATNKANVSPIDTTSMMLVKENKATLNIDGVDYKLDSYIKLFQQPYYVSVSRVDGAPITREVATKIAKEYIKPRGCTESLKRDSSLDQSNTDNSRWIIGIVC